MELAFSDNHQHTPEIARPNRCTMSSSTTWDFLSFLGTPSPSCTIPQTFHEPSPEEELKVERLIAYFGNEEYDVPGAEKGGLSDWEMMFLVGRRVALLAGDN